MATLADLKTAVRVNADAVNNSFFGESDIANWVNGSIAKLRDIMIEAGQHYFVKQYAFTLSTINTVDISALPGGFYKDQGLDLLPGGSARPRTIHRIDSFLDRNRSGRRYFIADQTLTVYPPTGGFAGNYNLFYVPDATLLVADGDTLPAEYTRWKEFIEIDSAILAKAKREMPSPELERRLTALTIGITNAAQGRMAEPAQIPMRREDDSMFCGFTGYPGDTD